MSIEVYTDGGARPNPGPGGWGVVILRPGADPRELSGGEDHTTNNRMELTAAIRALEALDPGDEARLHTDSAYLRNGITRWLPGWVERGWKRKGGKVENEDLWRRLAALDAEREVEWRWVKAHAGHRWNERADALASAEIRAHHDGAPPPSTDGLDREVFLRISAARGDGGWAATVRQPGEEWSEETEAGAVSDVTANRLDVLAAAEVLERLPEGLSVAVYTGSDYLRNGASQWIHGWKKGGWKTRGGGSVANRDAWERLDRAMGRHQEVRWPAPGAEAEEIFKALDKRAQQAREEGF